MSVLQSNEVDRSTMSPLDEVASPTSVGSELMVTDMLDEHDSDLNDPRNGKRKRDMDGEGLSPRKLPSLSSNNNDVGFVLEESGDDGLHEDADNVSLKTLFPDEPLTFTLLFLPTNKIVTSQMNIKINLKDHHFKEENITHLHLINFSLTRLVSRVV